MKNNKVASHSNSEINTEKSMELNSDKGNDNKIVVEPSRGVRDTLYGGIDVSVKTMDRVIIALMIILIIAIIFGVIL